MARGRMVNTTIATDKRLAALSLNAEYLYLKTLPHLDRDGLILGDASILWAEVAPRRTDLLPETEKAVRAWAASGLVITYGTPDGLALFFPSFADNQIGLRYDREPASTIQAPPGYVRTPAGLVQESVRQSSGDLPAEIQQESDDIPAEVKGKEVKVREEAAENTLTPEITPPAFAFIADGFPLLMPEPDATLALAVSDASAPPAKPGPKPKGAPPPDPNLENPAVIAYREKFHLTLNKDQRAAVASAVTDLPKWQATLDYWSLKDWHKNNIPGLLDVYANGPNSKRNGNGAPANTAPPITTAPQPPSPASEALARAEARQREAWNKLREANGLSPEA